MILLLHYLLDRQEMTLIELIHVPIINLCNPCLQIDFLCLNGLLLNIYFFVLKFNSFIILDIFFLFIIFPWISSKSIFILLIPLTPLFLSSNFWFADFFCKFFHFFHPFFFILHSLLLFVHFLGNSSRLRRPPVPPWTFTTKNVENEIKQTTVL